MPLPYSEPHAAPLLQPSTSSQSLSPLGRKMLGLDRCTVLALADAVELPRLHAGRTVRYAVVDIERLVECMRTGETLLRHGDG